ncbi:multidrug effflux MFS transporter [Constantimarinum furrinae]|uniref:MFS transporter n=1 Tax=Constantimarinum furrinae TaxID=2562285 RepID=A0A7G8PWQ1_9FLAO|nr:MFS transporter [Constantimarinum furrinae]
MALLMSVVALAIDALLPALDIIGLALGTDDPADNQLLIISIFLGLGLGPLIFGPFSDSKGRKPTVYIGFVIFIIASFICVFAPNLEIMLLGRVLQGIGLSAPRTIAIAIIRDMYSGDYMARIMSFVTVVFILVPIIAPLLGKFLLDHYNWEAIFYVQLILSVLVTFWFWLRQPETLAKAHRTPFTLKVFGNGFRELFRHRTTVGYTIITGFITGSFLVYLSSSQQIFQIQYGFEDAFPFIFAGLAISIGSAILLNGTVVLRFGMKKLILLALFAFFAISITYVIAFYNTPNPGIGVLLGFFALLFFAIGFLFGNLRAIAMEPVGHIAGIAAALTGLISTLMAVPVSIVIGRQISGTALPLFVGFTVCAGLSLLVLWFVRTSKV